MLRYSLIVLLCASTTFGQTLLRLETQTQGSLPISRVTSLQATLDAKQSLDSDLTAIAALTTDSFGRALLTKTDASAIRTYIGVGAGTGDALTTDPLSQFAATTSSQFKGVISDENAPDGASSKVIMALGSLSIASGKTLTNSNNLTLTATDGSTLAIGGGGTLGTAAYTASSAYQGADGDLDTWATLTPSANFQTLVTETFAQIRTSLGLVIGTNIEAWDADLDTWATLTPSANAQTLIGHTFSQMRTDLSLVIGTNVEAWDADLDTWATLTPSANAQTLLGHTFSQMRTDLSLVIGTNVEAWSANLDSWSAIATTTKEPVSAEQTIANVDGTWSSADNFLRRTTAILANRAVTLPLAAAFASGSVITYVDKVTGASVAFNVTFSIAGSDTINGGSSYTPFAGPGTMQLESDGVSKWTSINDTATITALRGAVDPTKVGTFDLDTDVGTGLTSTIIWPNVSGGGSWRPAVNSVGATHTALTLELGSNGTDTTIARSGAGAITVEGVQVILSGAAGGTPSSLTLTNATGLPVAGITSSTSTALGVGTLELGAASDTTLSRSSAGVLAVEGTTVPLNSTSSTHTASTIELGAASDTTLSRASAGVLAVEGTNVILNGGAGGTPSSLTLTNATALPISGLTASTSTALGVGSIELGAASDTTIARSGAGAITVEGTAVLLSGGAGGTPSSLTLTNATALPVSGITASTSTALGVGSVELGAASDTTIARSGAGAITVEGVQVILSGAAGGTPSSMTGTNISGTADSLTAGDVTRNHAVYAGASPPTVDVGVFTIAVTGVNMKAAGTTTVFTVPTSRKFVCTGAYFIVTAVTTPGAGTETFKIQESGSSAAMTAATASGSGTPAVGTYYAEPDLPGSGPFTACAAGNIVQVVVSTSQAGSTAVTGTIFVTGFYSA